MRTVKMVNMEVDPALWRAAKIAAATRCVTLREFVETAIVQAIGMQPQVYLERMGQVGEMGEGNERQARCFRVNVDQEENERQTRCIPVSVDQEENERQARCIPVKRMGQVGEMAEGE